MKNLAKIQSLSFKCFVCVWILDWFTHIGRECAYGWRYHSPGLTWNYDLHSSAGYAFFGLLSILLGWKYLKRRTAKGDGDNYRSLIQEIAHLCPLVLVPRAVGLMITSGVFIVFTYFFAYCAMDGVTKAAACIADYSTNYELAERIFRVYNSLDLGRSFASWRTHFCPENEKVRAARNIAVTRVYGPNSLQMADRYKYVGENIIITTHSDPLQSKEAVVWLQKSLNIYRTLGANERSIDTLNQLALAKLDQDNYSQLGPILLQASKLLEDSGKSSVQMANRGYYSSSLAMLSYLAGKAGDKHLANLFIAKSIEVNKQCNDSSDYFWPKYEFSVLIALLAINVLPMRVNILEWMILHCQYKLAYRKFLHSGDLSTSIAELNAMITIDLYGGKSKKAWDNSIHALRLAGIESTGITNNFVERRISFSPAMLAESVHAALFVGLFFTVFYR